MIKKILLITLCGAALVGCGKKETAASEASLVELDLALQSAAVANGKFPEKIDELSDFLALQGKRLPAPPPGKQFAIDSTNRTIILVSQ